MHPSPVRLVQASFARAERNGLNVKSSYAEDYGPRLHRIIAAGRHRRKHAGAKQAAPFLAPTPTRTLGF